MTIETAAPIIRRAVPEDAPALAELARRSFVDAFGEGSDPHDLALHVARGYGQAQQAAEIAHPRITTLVAEVDGRLAAYAMIRRDEVPECVPDRTAAMIARFYVDRPWHGRGLARRLMDAALDEVRALGARSVWLGVWEMNHRAIAFYAKCGYRDVGSHTYLFGTDPQTDRVMLREV
ncbi:MAG TPA: GNAT family N-acetyltransferase [Longimicrobium sp.]|nr:GNAT family N-acetyltransferase [Longimicrobium sp.]